MQVGNDLCGPTHPSTRVRAAALALPSDRAAIRGPGGRSPVLNAGIPSDRKGRLAMARLEPPLQHIQVIFSHGRSRLVETTKRLSAARRGT
jgi:hypothetical protein